MPRTGRAHRALSVSLVVTALACGEVRETPTAQSVTLVEDLRLDANAENFSVVRNVVVGPRGRIAVPLRQDYQVWIYDSTGKRIATVGQRGSGPGEFQAVSPIGWVADTMWIHDFRSFRMTYVSPGGELLRTVPLPGDLARVTPFTPGGGLSTLSIDAVYPDGSMLGNARLVPTARATTASASAMQLIRIAPTGEWRSIAVPPAIEDERWFMTVGGLGREIPFASLPKGFVTADGSRFGFLTTEITSTTGGTYTVAVYRATGDTAFVRSYPFTGIPIPASARDSAVAAEATPAEFAEGPRNTDMKKIDVQFQKLARERMPPVYAPVASFVLGLDETVWLTLRDSAGVRPVLILDGEGNQVGRVSISPRSTIRHASASHIWITEVDDDGLASVVRYRVSGLPAQRTIANPRTSSTPSESASTR